ncbi:lanthionine synthetase LanC family protein [Bernardetia sp. ABR2-2B]|uniref:lanthionine synthetase LanC family protein n=1 Tax=Bernardetia sp. ABR2-2B TaxID=3127472 RepID=UPI0030D5F453
MKTVFNNLPNVFFSNFGYLGNLGSLSLIANFDSEKAEQMLTKFYEKIEEAPYVQPDIYGLSSLGILLNYLSKVDKNRFEEYNEEFINDFSSVILEASQAMAERLEYDTFTGLVCTLNYFVLTEQIENTLKVVDLLQKVTQQLYQKKELNNLGLAHGVCGIIAVLAKTILFLEKTETTNDILVKYKDTLELITNHVMNQKGEIGNFCFPYTVGGKTSRLAWCYGDFSICIALTWAALVLPNKKKIDKVVQATINNAINLKDTDRLFITNKDTKEYDLALCHGVSGVYLVFKRLYDFYPSQELAEEIKRLKEELHKEVQKGIENIKFPVSIQQEPLIFEWQTDLSFLNGLSGFLAAYHDDELVKGWDAPLLTDF